VPVGDLGRRRWPDEVKAGIAAHSFAPGAVIAVVARRHGLSPQQLFAWRRRARQGDLAVPVADHAPFAPVVLAAVGEAVGRVEAAPATGAGVIEIRLGSAIVRVGAEVTGEHLTRVLLAVKAAG
jgi:transposase